ncbi:signal recognition particle-docking protein FtsY [Candidatus Dependentiae bacterium]|nr:signal recognition particle-docking protein FtsY [Candidatus Dependentiae bacterium]
MFNFIKSKLKKIYTQVSEKLFHLFSLKTIDQSTIDEIEKLLISADMGIDSTKKIIKKLQAAYCSGNLSEGSDIKQLLEQELLEMIPQTTIATSTAKIFLLVGINGSGKTTFAGKLAHYLTQQNKSCLLVAADTFRAAAPEQLKAWAKTARAHLFLGKPNQDPASLVFDACEKFKKESYDYLIIDTAGRLQTKDHLLKELEKIKRIITKQLPNQIISTLLTIDAMLGQNSLEQATIFHQVTTLNGIVLTKLDGTAKGGIIFAITHQLNIPILFVSYGEGMSDMAPFDNKQYIQNLLHDTHYQSLKQQS